MTLSQNAPLFVLAFLLLSAVCLAKKKGPSGPSTHTCGITKGYKLQSFAKAKAKLVLPCRYMLTEFMCNTKTRVWAESSFSRKDGYTYVSGVGVTITRDGEESDTASISMEDFKKFMAAGDTTAPHWNTSGRGLLEMSQNEGSSWRLRDNYDAADGRTVLTDGSGELTVALKYVDGETAKSKKGGLTVTCSSSGFSGMDGSSGYLCGNLGSAGQTADTKHHIKEAASKLKMSTTQYLIYTTPCLYLKEFLKRKDLCVKVAEVTSNVSYLSTETTENSLCEEAAEVTSKWADPVLAVKTCWTVLDGKSYAKCFVKNNIDPLEAYAQCVKWRCRRDILACRYLEKNVLTCPGKLKGTLRCSGGGGGGGGKYN